MVMGDIMATGIIGIDMHIRDERVLEHLCRRSTTGKAQVPAKEIAREFNCHLNTAQAILRRLVLAGKVEVDRSQFRGGYFYRVKHDRS
jgi:DNA-binding IclR family transcriptional regulator